MTDQRGRPELCPDDVYIVLIEAPDSSWQPNWDGVAHVTEGAALTECQLARSAGHQAVVVRGIVLFSMTDGRPAPLPPDVKSRYPL